MKSFTIACCFRGGTLLLLFALGTEICLAQKAPIFAQPWMWGATIAARKNAAVKASSATTTPNVVNDSTAQQEFEPHWSVLFGLIQPILLRGFNVEGNYWWEQWVLDYSHGFSLQMSGERTGGELKEQGLNMNVSHSLGLGLGYRFTKEFNLRIEPKIHIFNVYYRDAEPLAANRLVEYTTYTLGLGAYYRWLPFEQSTDWVRGLTIVPSVRYWYRVASSLQNNQYTYQNRITARQEVHNAANIGIANTPWIINISIGYSF